MSDLLKKTYEAAIAAKRAAEQRRSDLQEKYEQFKNTVETIWEDLELKEQKFTLKDGTVLCICSKGVAFNTSVTYALLVEAEEIIASYLELEIKKYTELFNK